MTQEKTKRFDDRTVARSWWILIVFTIMTALVGFLAMGYLGAQIESEDPIVETFTPEGIFVQPDAEWNTSILESRPPEAREIRKLGWLVVFIAAGIFLVVEFLLIFAIFRYRRTAKSDDGSEPVQLYGSNPIELAWTIIPIMIVFVLCLATIRTIQVVQPTKNERPENALTVEVIGHRWWWEFRYPELDVVTANEMFVPYLVDALLLDPEHPRAGMKEELKAWCQQHHCEALAQLAVHDGSREALLRDGSVVPALEAVMKDGLSEEARELAAAAVSALSERELVLATDGEERLLDVIRANAPEAAVRRLDWAAPDISETFDVVLGADLIYSSGAIASGVPTFECRGEAPTSSSSARNARSEALPIDYSRRPRRRRN